MLDLKSYLRTVDDRLRSYLNDRRLKLNPNWRGVEEFPPGHFHSPLLDIENLANEAAAMALDGPEYWEHIDLRPAEQQSLYNEFVEVFDVDQLNEKKTDGRRYYSDNPFFRFPDGFTLFNIIKKNRPQKIIEIGCGFSSALMIDTLSRNLAPADLTFVDPVPKVLQSVLSAQDLSRATVLEQSVQRIDLSVFDQLAANDILFLDSSHVAKIGSDVTFILLRVLPRLQPGVLVHFHDIFYPFSYPIEWTREGRAWNESMFLRAFLIGNSDFEILAFNSYAGFAFPEVFRGRLDRFLQEPGGSCWLRKQL